MKEVNSYAYSYGYPGWNTHLAVGLGGYDQFTDITPHTIDETSIDKPGDTHIPPHIVDTETTMTVPIGLQYAEDFKQNAGSPAFIEFTVEAQTSLFLREVAFTVDFNQMLDNVVLSAVYSLVDNDRLRKIVVFAYGIIKPRLRLPTIEAVATFQIYGNRSNSSFIGITAEANLRMSRSFLTLNVPKAAHIKRRTKRSLPAVVAQLAPPCYPWEALQKVAESQ